MDKVETPDGGDYLRNMPPLLGDESALFFALNRNKRSVCLDLKAAQGPAALLRMVRHYDVVLESFRPGVLTRLGCDWNAMRAQNGRLIYCAITGYGQEGPDAQAAGHDLNYIARAGVLGLGQQAQGRATMPGGQMADVGGALFGVIGILAALEQRRRTGEGRFVDIAMADAATAFAHMNLGAAWALGPQGASTKAAGGPLNGGLAAYNIYPTLDGRQLAVAALEPKFFEGLCARLGRPDLIDGAYDVEGGGAARVRAALEDIFKTQALSHWLKVFEGADVCVEAVATTDEVFSNRQFAARGLFTIDAAGRQMRTPLGEGPRPSVPAPKLGAHTREVLAECGFSASEIDRIVAGA